MFYGLINGEHIIYIQKHPRSKIRRQIKIINYYSESIELQINLAKEWKAYLKKENLNLFQINNKLI